MEWALWFEMAHRQVQHSLLPGGVYVSTVFLGLDHRWDEGLPLVFETMVFGGPEDGYMRRYSTWAEAKEGHIKCLLVCGVKLLARRG